jgi:hypothetical protein
MRDLYSTELAGQVRHSRFFIFTPDSFTCGMFSRLNANVELPLVLRSMDA